MLAAVRYGLPALALFLACVAAPPPPERGLAVAQDSPADAGPPEVAIPAGGAADDAAPNIAPPPPPPPGWTPSQARPSTGAETLADAGPGPATIVYDDVAPAFGWLRARVPILARQAARADAPVLFRLEAGHVVQLMGRRGSWFLIEWHGGRGPSLAVPLGAHGWIAVDPSDSAKVERLALTDAGVPANQ